MSIGIYKIENIHTKKVYIGQSTNIEKRWQQHMLPSMRNNPNKPTYNFKLYKAFRKYGLEAFQFSILEECSENELDEKERYWIEYYDSYKNGYNMTIGGKLSSEFYKETTKSMQGRKKYWVQVDQYSLQGEYIRTFPNITMAVNNTEGISSPSTLIACLKDRQKSYGGYLWRYHGQAPPNAYQDNRLGHTTSSNKRSVNQYFKNGQFITSYESAHEAARQINKPKCANHITECCQGKRKTCEGYIWKYKEN